MNRRSGWLRPFLEGAGSVLDLFGTSPRRRCKNDLFIRDDAEALAQDWKVVWQDFAVVERDLQAVLRRQAKTKRSGKR